MTGPLRDWAWNGDRAATPDDLGVPGDLDATTLLLERNVTRGLGSAVAVREVGGDVLTYRELRDLVTETAAGLPWPPGSRVVVHLGHTVEFIVCALALLRAGLVLVPVPSTADLREMLEIVEDAGPVAVLSHRARELPSGCDVVQVGWTGPLTERLAALLVRPDRRGPDRPRRRTDEAYWLYTSGTSGRPKAARHRHQDIACAAVLWAGNVLDLGRAEKCLSLSPVTHSFGLAAGCLFPLWAGAEVVVVRATHHRAIWQAIRDEGVGRLFGVPRHFLSLLDRATRDGHRIRAAYSSGEYLPPELQQRFTETLGVPLLDAMGSSETFTNPISSTASAWRPGSSGRVIPGVTARLVAGGAVVEGAGTGILEIASAANAFGYWNRSAASSRTFRDGYCHTGDIFRRDADGFLYYQGRDSSRFKVFGEFVDPLRLEVAARRVPGVMDAVAFEVPGRGGLAACGMALILTPGTDEPGTAGAVRAEVLSGVGNFAVPHSVFVVPEFPTTHSGKLRRAAMAAFAPAHGRTY
ncbi:class I adenylate-forming enzyme family protein [Actinoplanes siamensis]|uniref:Benzoate--CoA ligase n=1 Tax=Actinoplanes siamensis TaxID=1223317 RepID=A0A919NBQ5_9ACTN|nr:class I adenylate-forming enzyme family protein [Actinoplanes siamensis]GIF08232.1 benzoate--CoA ligase [Actinoplanes siamensis]